MKSCVRRLGFRKYSLELIYISSILFLILSSVESSSFKDNFEISWGTVNLLNNGQIAQLNMDRSSGSGFQSINQYLFGSASMGVKLVPGNSAGTVTSYYMSSKGSSHDELDIEFLGNLSGMPVDLQTNVYANGVGNREQRIRLWFDPRADFHNYSILWNHQQIVFWVDSTPIRVFKNNEAAGIAFPNSQPMRIFSTIYDADSWVTEGGRVKIDWSQSPFVASYRSFEISACNVSSHSSPSCANNWWDQTEFQSLNQYQLGRLQWVRKNYLTYDYCGDRARYATPPPECSLNP